MANILAVDDSPSIRKLVSATLSKAGHSVESAKDGQEGLEKAGSNVYDIVITDVHMPVMDGITLTENLRKLDACRFIPILILTTESASDMKLRGKQAGATGWIVKPFNPDSLIKVIDRVLG